MDIFEKCMQPSPADAVREAGLYPYFQEIEGKQHSEVLMHGRRTIMLGSNNYLGLTSDRRVIDAAKRALDEFGTGCSGSRFLNGTLTLHAFGARACGIHEKRGRYDMVNGLPDQSWHYKRALRPSRLHTV